MKKKNRALLFKALLVLYVVCVAYLCFAKFDGDDNLPKLIFGIEKDKVEHFFMFLPFPILFFLSFKNVSRKMGKAIAWALNTFVIGALFAASTEIIQHFIPYRQGDIHDFIADILALGIACVITLVLNIHFTLKKRDKK